MVIRWMRGAGPRPEPGDLGRGDHPRGATRLGRCRHSRVHVVGRARSVRMPDQPVLTVPALSGWWSASATRWWERWRRPGSPWPRSPVGSHLRRSRRPCPSGGRPGRRAPPRAAWRPSDERAHVLGLVGRAVDLGLAARGAEAPWGPTSGRCSRREQGLDGWAPSRATRGPLVSVSPARLQPGPISTVGCGPDAPAAGWKIVEREPVGADHGAVEGGDVPVGRDPGRERRDPRIGRWHPGDSVAAVPFAGAGRRGGGGRGGDSRSGSREGDDGQCHGAAGSDRRASDRSGRSGTDRISGVCTGRGRARRAERPSRRACRTGGSRGRSREWPPGS